MALLSIITICYNNLEGLKKTVNSVLSQTNLSDVEYIIIDGGSNDGTKEYLSTLPSSIIYVSERDKGIYNAMNKGISIASGSYLQFLNSGDVLYDSSVLDDILPMLITSPDSLKIGRVISTACSNPSPINYDITLLTLYSTSIPHPSTFIPSNLIRRFMYDESYKICSDWKFFLQAIILDNVDYRFIDRIVALFDTTGISSTNKTLSDNERKKILEELFPSRILRDYFTFQHGKSFEDTCYENFFQEFKTYRLGGLIYSISVIIMRFLSPFISTARLSHKYPIRRKK